MRRAVVGRRAPQESRSPEDRLATLFAQLIEALREGHVELAPCRTMVCFGLDTDRLLEQIHLLERSIYDFIEERGLPVPPGEMRLLAEWLRSLTEEVLREEHHRFTAVLDAVPDHLALQDPTGRLLYVNRATSDTVTPSYRGRRLRELGIPDAVAQKVDEGLARALKGETDTSEIRIPTAGSGWRWHECKISPVYDNDGRIEAVAIASRDIHERRAAQARLQLLAKMSMLAETMEYEDVLSGVAQLAIPELADWCVVDVVEEGRLRRAKVAHGDPAKAAIAEKLMQVEPPSADSPKRRQLLEGRSVVVAQISDKWRHEPGLEEVIRYTDACSVMVVPVRRMGKPVAIATFIMSSESGRRYGPEDVTLAEELVRRSAQILDNTRLQQELRRSEARFRMALAHSSISVFETDRDLRIRWAFNPWFGLAPEQEVVVTNRDPISPDQAKEMLDRRVLDTGERVRAELDFDIGGRPRHLKLNYEGLRDESGAIVGITGSAIDITDAKKAQEELVQALDFRERMMGVLGHDLRNPLGAVLVLTQLLLNQKGLQDKMRERVQRIDTSAHRMKELIETLLDVTRTRFQGGLPINRESVDLRELAGHVVDELRAARPEREIRLASRGDVRGQWDPGRLAQVLSNLVGNALTHGAPDTAVEVQLTGGTDDVMMEVTNRGPAIPAELIDHLFEPFRQAPGARASGRSGGLGLGLFIVRQVVLAHGGTISVRSNDEATTFAVRLARGMRD